MKVCYPVFLFLLSYGSGFTQSSVNDCAGAIPICENTLIAQPLGVGTNDFASPENDAGCLLSGENASAWFRLDFLPDTPDTTRLAFTISGILFSDYDFALYAQADGDCSDLGSPVRCSFSFQGITGLALNETDASENVGNGFTAPVTPQDGQSFFLFVNNYTTIPDTLKIEFTAGADALACTPGVVCELSQSPDTLCSGDAFELIGSTSFAGSWTAIPESGLLFLEDPSEVSTFLSLPTALPSQNFTFTFVPDHPADADDCAPLSFDLVVRQALQDLLPLDPLCENPDGTVTVDLPAYAAQYADSVELQFATLNGPTLPTAIVDLPVGAVLSVGASTQGCSSDLTLPIPLLDVPLPLDIDYSVCADSTDLAVFDLDLLAGEIANGADQILFRTPEGLPLEGSIVSPGDTVLAYGVLGDCESAPTEIALLPIPAPLPPELVCTDATETSITFGFGENGIYDYQIVLNGDVKPVLRTTDTAVVVQDLPAGTDIEIRAWTVTGPEAPCSFVSRASTIICATNLSSATNDSFQESALKIFPNPTTGLIVLDLPPGSLPDYATILDLSGRPVLAQRGPDSQLEVSALPSGLYMLIVTDNQGRTFRQLFVKD